MVIFYSYVKLPEGRRNHSCPFFPVPGAALWTSTERQTGMFESEDGPGMGMAGMGTGQVSMGSMVMGAGFGSAPLQAGNVKMFS